MLPEACIDASAQDTLSWASQPVSSSATLVRVPASAVTHKRRPRRARHDHGVLAYQVRTPQGVALVHLLHCANHQEQ